MALVLGSELPEILNKKDPVIFNKAEYNLSLPSIENLKKYFKTDTNNKITRYGLKDWNEFPHFASFYYNSEKKLVSLFAMTDKGFESLTQK